MSETEWGGLPRPPHRPRPQPLDAQAARIAFGERLRELRRKHGLSQDDLWWKSDVHSTAVGRLERGHREPRLTTILRLAEAIGCRPGELVDDLDVPRAP